ncbi:receptor-type tyrosine-protein kinase FLT3 isoform X2 [Notolabrus celidotus]|uniref:receptor-type tyrosine-protein kinase FLT3 isoform X2 n=1 Tax=Notolabrus celidotus TaxID=1203425 RepID=UPI0014905AE3|nr:receptor-type tyrosine-protein kinase FLT3 isoform X2 [Notolabrus celidotus]
MIVAVLLLWAELLGSDGLAAQTPACVPSHEVACFVPSDHLNVSGTVSVEVFVGKKLVISLDRISESPVCSWTREAGPVVTVNGSQSMVLPPLSEADSGEYMLSCVSSSSMTVFLHVVMKRPSKPKLTMDRLDEQYESPNFICISEGFPKPTIKWSGSNESTGFHTDGGSSGSKISSGKYYNKRAMCCATNAGGQECSQVYDYDLQTDVMKKNEVSNVTLSPGQSLVLRCTVLSYNPPHSVWEIGSRRMSDRSLKCSSKVKKEICIQNDSLYNSLMTYLYIQSVHVNHTGTYTCRSPSNKVKSVYINIQEEGFLSSQLDERKILLAGSASKSCLQAQVSYHPVLQNCSWEAPNKTVTKCIRDQWVTKHSTVKLCDPLRSGDYKLHLEAGGQNETKTVTVCVADPPKFKFSADEADETFTFKTVSPVPANYTWKCCPSANDSDCDSDSTWKVIESGSDSNISCSKTLKSSVGQKDCRDGHYLKFCLTNSVGSWCQTQLPIYYSTLVSASRGAPNDESGSLMVLKVGSVVLLLALAVVSIVLAYFVKKKKPQYQPQLQIIQMVGPNDNDYIYINFKDFEYDKKWEFPRENLEMGKELGSGAFGMVLQATAYGISKPGVSQQVAVKMLKEKHQTVEKEALMSELKMLTHIGHHVNVVNLLGACTDSGPTYLIFQYCCYGDLLNYLKKNRELYHKSVTDAFNKDRFSCLYHNLQPRKSSSEGDAGVGHYMPMYRATTRGQEDIALLTLNSTDMDSFEGPEIFENPDDPAEDLQTLTFDDLLNFAFQVAKGMDFLSSKNCIHRDLAARNVLVTNGRLVKIGDFGLARDIDNDSNYVVRGNVRLPVKWMAPESTFQGIYTMKSDVWAYGILLWEIFSLGVTPYPGMKVDHTFYSMIERGFKMECPYYADEAVYGMMCKCWALDPCDRPSFSKLVSFMCDRLMDREEKLYHNVTELTSSVYQNAADVLDISALETQSENNTQSANDYQAQLTEGSKAETLEAVAAEEKLLKTSHEE